MKAKTKKKRLAVSKTRIHALMRENGACAESYARVDEMLKDPEKYIRLYNKYWFTEHALDLTLWCHALDIACDLKFVGVRTRYESGKRRRLSLTYINSELERLCEEHGI